MSRTLRTVTRGGALLVASMTILTGCIYSSKETERVSPAPRTVVVPAPQRVYTYPEGRYELQGRGTPESPYYWVWIPAGTQTIPPAPPPPPLAGH